MKYVDIKTLGARLIDLKKEYQSKKPFRYVVFEDFFPKEIAEVILKEYPSISNGEWAICICRTSR